VVWSFDIFVHFDQKSFVIIFLFFIVIIMTLEIIYSKAPSQHFAFRRSSIVILGCNIL
jgi:hypothetical protein